MIDPARGEPKTRVKVFHLKVRHFLKDLLRREAGCE
jgi:hypothetical protein